ncbi:hypothetical protein B0H63DRAFT_448482 [Podospora didyma]|uniref:Uncharacterized protein n=1 Tax=Podospora didyma TaxID=330526 RepID=A0AAE0NTX4_9PEZI|nr:hypothetical protein B0H63DRAFT_448482 [Podospora didyma]
MHASIIALGASALAGFAVASNGKCHGQRLYCGHSLTSMGWTIQQIRTSLGKGTQWYPDGMTDADLTQTLFECDGRRGDDALWYRSSCAENGCHDAGSGHSDYCA